MLLNWVKQLLAKLGFYRFVSNSVVANGMAMEDQLASGHSYPTLSKRTPVGRPYKMVLTQVQCTVCRKHIKKAYIPFGKSDMYDSFCLIREFNYPVSEEELNVPTWVVEKAEKYVKYRIKQYTKKGVSIEYKEFADSFYSMDFGVKMTLFDDRGASLLDSGLGVYMNGKHVKKEWLTAIHYYLMDRRDDIRDEYGI